MGAGAEDVKKNKSVPQDDGFFELKRSQVRRVWTLFFLVVFFVLFLLFLWRAVTVLLIIFAGTLIALALRFISDTVSHYTRIPPLWSLTLLLLVVALGIGGGAIWAAPSIAEQITQLIAGLQESIADLERNLRETKSGKWFLQQIGGQQMEDLPGIWTRIASMFTMTFTAVAGFALTVLVGVFLAYNPQLYISGFLRLVPLEKRKRVCEVLAELGNNLRWWMLGQLISMVFLAITTWLMLWILGVPLSFILGLITGILTFIPYLGPIIALVPILLISFVASPTLALWVLALYLVVQNIEANVLMPIIFAKTVHLPPVLTIIAQILLGGIFGFVGVILATPLMAAGIVIVKMVYVEDVIGDEMKESIKEYPA
jgi:predicted PurR-regulated permease PerM